VIFIDSNIPMYLVGAPHPNKAGAQRLLERSITDNERLVTDAEVLQEILHRYISIGRRDAIQPAFDALSAVVDDVFPIDRASVERAKQILFTTQGLSARDALHLAVMERHRVTRIMSFDGGFDDFPGITRLSG